MKHHRVSVFIVSYCLRVSLHRTEHFYIARAAAGPSRFRGPRRNSSRDGCIRQIRVECIYRRHTMRVYISSKAFSRFLTHSRNNNNNNNNNATTEIVRAAWGRDTSFIYSRISYRFLILRLWWLLKGHFPLASSPLCPQPGPLCLLLRRIYAWTLAILLSRTHDELRSRAGGTTRKVGYEGQGGGRRGRERFVLSGRKSVAA